MYSIFFELVTFRGGPVKKITLYVTMSEILARFMVQGNMTRRAVVLWSWQDCVAETERPKPNLFSFKYHTRSIFPDWACPP